MAAMVLLLTSPECDKVLSSGESKFQLEKPQHNWALFGAANSIICGEGNGTPLQYSCLENPWTEEPGGLQSMGSLRVGHD